VIEAVFLRGVVPFVKLSHTALLALGAAEQEKGLCNIIYSRILLCETAENHLL
jgi:hypothetical protein